MSLKYKTNRIASAKAAMIEPRVHLFLESLFVMVTRIFLLLLILSSTPCNCKMQMGKWVDYNTEKPTLDL